MFANAVLWGAYGLVVVNDSSIIIPNAVGALVSLLQLVVHVVFASGLVKAKGMGVRVASL